MKIIIIEYIVLVIKRLIGGRRRKVILLMDHDVFTSLDRARNETLNMDFYTSKKFDLVKTRMCYDFAETKTNVCAEQMKALIKTKNINYISRAKLKRTIIKAQNDMHTEYIKQIRAAWLSKGISNKDVDYVVRMFERFRRPVVTAFEHRIDSIFGNTFNRDNFSLMLAVCEMWSLGVDLLPDDMKDTFENLNGKFKDMKY